MRSVKSENRLTIVCFDGEKKLFKDLCEKEEISMNDKIKNYIRRCLKSAGIK